MHVLIIEDEKPAAQKLIRLLEGINTDINVVGVLKSVEDSINWFTENVKPDLIFMDIQLEDGICFEIFETTKIHTPVIFTTAYDEYTLKAFKVNSVDYLLKPIDTDHLSTAIQKFNKHFNSPNYSNFEDIINHLQPKRKERFLIKIGEHYKSIQTSDINCFYIKERCNFLYTNSGKIYPIEFSLDKIEKMVDSKYFFRINRNTIINYNIIEDIIAYSSNRLKIEIEGWKEDDIIVSRERVTDFKNWIDR